MIRTVVVYQWPTLRRQGVAERNGAIGPILNAKLRKGYKEIPEYRISAYVVVQFSHLISHAVLCGMSKAK
jgi:hypothetical protein